MYIFYLTSLCLIGYAIVKCSKKNKKKVNKFDYKEKFTFMIHDIKFYKDKKYIDKIQYNNNNNNKEKTIELNVNFLYDYYIVNYEYNNKLFKYYSDNNFLTIPIYSEKQIKKYVYVNNIKEASLIIKKENEKDIKYDIKRDLVPFLGPNYNFYKDLDIKLNTFDILKYISIYNFEIKNIIDTVDTVDKEHIIIKLKDNFGIEHENNSEYLFWNPNLKL
jgi:hypothetical protein